jgi:CRP-like cAMP-binding protein
MNVEPQEDFKVLINYLEQFVKVPEAMAKLILRETTVIELKKRKHLVSPLDLKPNLYFILTGLVRGFDRDDNIDTTSWIAVEGQIVGLMLCSATAANGRRQYIETLEDSKAIMIPNALVNTLFTLFPEMGTIGLKLLWLHYNDAEERNYLTRLSSAEKRLRRMIHTHPQFYYRTPIKYLASYLCMRMETLSRLRAQLLTEKVMV